MTLQTAGVTRPVLAFALGIAALLITGLVWANVSMATSWAGTISTQTAQNTKDIATLREEYRVINAKLDSMNELLKLRMSGETIGRAR